MDIPFAISARTAHLIGLENFANAEGAIVELVKNSYDADADICVVVADIKKNIVADASVVGDVKEVLNRLNERLPQYQHKEWMEHIHKMQESYPLAYNQEGLSGPYVIEKIYEMCYN